MRFAARQKKERTAADAVLFLYISSHFHLRIIFLPTKQIAVPAPRHSHSMVAGGFDDTSYTTRLTPLTLFIISFESRASTS